MRMKNYIIGVDIIKKDKCTYIQGIENNGYFQ